MKNEYLPGKIILFAVLLATLFSGCQKHKNLSIRPVTVRVDSLSQVVLVTDSIVKPFLYTHVSGLDRLTTRRSKAVFVSVLLPSILVARHQIDVNRSRIELLNTKAEWSVDDSVFYLGLKKRYKATSVTNLLARMISLPNSIVLAQAAIESGWGQSRFFLEANNVFGIWSYRKHEPRILARKKRNKKAIYVRRYDNTSQSIIDYFETLGSAKSYHTLRKAHWETKDPFDLIPHLKNYSERRTYYTAQLKRLIVANNLTRYDHYQLDPEYFVED
jgi:Bax protein